MPTYDFKSINDKDFESLVTDLLSAEIGLRLERFKAGRDGGIDARLIQKDGTTIVQCKHWARTPFSALLRSLKSNELIKVKDLNPERYILVTSIELSAANKCEIERIFHPYIKNQNDILGLEDLNDLLGKHSSIEKKHPRLWLSSAEILKTVINSPIIGRSKDFIQEILVDATKYVETSNHKRARHKLEHAEVVIITGEPGIGKTTLAKQLCLEYLREGYEIAVINNTLSEGEAAFVDGNKTIFYMDDFLGRNYLEALQSKEDTEIASFIKRVRQDPLKRFILTSRSTVLNQAKRLSDVFSVRKIDRDELEIHIKSLTRWDRALILYNHFWHSDLSKEYTEMILRDKNYLAIIDHKNFNPRLIEFIFDSQRIPNTLAAQYWQHIQRSLNNPEAVWQHVYDGQLNQYTKILLLLVAFNGRAISETNLQSAYALLAPSTSLATRLNSDFNNHIGVAVGSVIDRRIESNSEVSYTLFNPSIGDYLVNRFKSDDATLIEIFFALNNLQSLRNLLSLRAAGYLTPKQLEHISSTVLRRRITNVNATPDALVTLIEIFISSTPKATLPDYLSQFIDGINIKDFSSSLSQVDAFVTCVKLFIQTTDRAPSWFKEWEISKLSLVDDELVSLCRLRSHLGDTDEAEHLHECLSEKFDEIIEDSFF